MKGCSNASQHISPLSYDTVTPDLTRSARAMAVSRGASITRRLHDTTSQRCTPLPVGRTIDGPHVIASHRTTSIPHFSATNY